MTSQLHEDWLRDQKLAFLAGILVGVNVEDTDELDEQLAQVTRLVGEECGKGSVRYLTDSTLNLLSSIGPFYHHDNPRLVDATPLDAFCKAAAAELGAREHGEDVMSPILLDHCLYLLKQSHLSIVDFFKWLTRNCRKELVLGLKHALAKISADAKCAAELDAQLEGSRSTKKQGRDRIVAIDAVYERICALVAVSSPNIDTTWWLRIALGLRNSLYCWPLIAVGDDGRRFGLSLPFGLFLHPNEEGGRDNKSPHYTIYQRGTRVPDRPYLEPACDEKGRARMANSSLYWSGDWDRAFAVGLRAAKDLWRTQNGRLRAADEAAAREVLDSTLVVDMGPACEIVDSVYGKLGGEFELSGSSAQAYWLQAILGLLLPEARLPYGVVTAEVAYDDGAYSLREVGDIKEKLHYANAAGFSRVILSGTQQDESAATTPQDASAAGTPQNELATAPVDTSARAPLNESVGMPGDEAVNALDETPQSVTTKPASQRTQVDAFLKALEDNGQRKRIEINYCSTARSAADAMQPSGWRRASFVRLPATQSSFSRTAYRLFLMDELSERRSLSAEGRKQVKAAPWTAGETRKMEELDVALLSKKWAINFVDRNKVFEGAMSDECETRVGQWLAWKDRQVRRGARYTPGMGILALRTTSFDNPTRIWATIADVLNASPTWWRKFQYANRDEAAGHVAELLQNRRAAAEIAATSAPDLLVIFDEGRLSHIRRNRIFPEDFRGQLYDLLNPRREDASEEHPLDDMLRRGEEIANGLLGPTRIIVIHGESPATSEELPPGLTSSEADDLARLAVFRFGFSIQAAYSMINYDRKGERLDWSAVGRIVERGMEERVIRRTRGQLYISSRCVGRLRKERYFGDPSAHFHAARALTPILDPRGLFVASNRDRSLEPESLLEAQWHLRTARALSPNRNRDFRSRIGAATSSLILLRPFPFWDTVKILQRHQPRDALELTRELLEEERATTGRPPHSSRVAAALNVIGAVGQSDHDSDTRAGLAKEANRLKKSAVADLVRMRIDDERRQRRKLFSEYLYCMKQLGEPNLKPEVRASREYLDQTMQEVLAPAFARASRDDLDDYPISRDWLRAEWQDNTLSPARRSEFALAAARLFVGREEDGEVLSEPWDQPWIEYFALTRRQDFSPDALHGALEAWNSIYGQREPDAAAFGKRVRDTRSLQPRANRDPGDLSPWGLQMRSAIDNLWDYIDPPARPWMKDGDVEIALRFIRNVAMGETFPAFDFVSRREARWRPKWPTCLEAGWSHEWQALGRTVVTSKAGWIHVLSSTSADKEGTAQVMAWLHAFASCGAVLDDEDPESLASVSNAFEYAAGYRAKRVAAIWNGYQVLAASVHDTYLVQEPDRARLLSVLDQIDAGAHAWFVALMKFSPSPATVHGVELMLGRVTQDQIRGVATAKRFAGMKDAVLAKMSKFISIAEPRKRGVFISLAKNLRGGGDPPQRPHPRVRARA